MTYPGGKNGPGVYQTLINQIPPHDTYIETHLGGGAVLRHKRPAALNIGIDPHSPALAVVATQIRLKHRRPRRGSPATTAANGDTFEEIQLTPPPVAMMATLAANDGTPASSPTATMPGGTVANGVAAAPPPVAIVARATIATHSGTRYEFHQTDCIPYLLNRKWQGGEFVYCDPPYLMHTRKGGRELYAHEYDDADHVALLSTLRRLPCMVMISGYWSELYADTLADWRTITYTTGDRGGNLRTEWAWMNYPAPTTLHEYTYLGDDYRERERIKRKRRRWVRMLADMPPLERMAIIEELIGLA